MKDDRLAAGTQVTVADEETGCLLRGVVVRHGRDRMGVYTAVQLEPGGSVVRFHRSALTAGAWRDLATKEPRHG